MDSLTVHAVIPSDYYFIPTSDSIVVRGTELINQVVSQRLPRDTFVDIIADAQYRFMIDTTPLVLSGLELANKIPRSEYLPIMGTGAFVFGAVIGWNLYFINRYRNRSTIGLADLATIISALAGVIILSFLDNNLILIGNYGLGVGVGFILYFLILVTFSLLTKDPKYKFPDFFLSAHEDQNPMIIKRMLVRIWKKLNYNIKSH